MTAGSFYFAPANWLCSIFEDHYPFDYWEERLRYLSQGGNIDTFLYMVSETLLSLVENYITVLTAGLGNPSSRWVSVERFAPPQKIAKVAALLGKPEGWRGIFQDPDFITLAPLPEQALVTTDEQRFSMLLGNHAYPSPSGEVVTLYPPEQLIESARRLAVFREENRGLLNAIKHGFRLPRHSDSLIDLIVSELAKHGEKPLYSADYIRQELDKLDSLPCFWLLETDLKGRQDNENLEGPTGRLTLFSVNPERALIHCRLVLEMLKLLFDSTRSNSRYATVASRLQSSQFGAMIEAPVRVHIPLERYEGDEPYVVSGFIRSD